MNAFEILTQLNSLDEHHAIEAKRGGDVDKAFLESVCAFSNEPGLGGGHIILGVEREEDSLFPSYTVTGISNPDGLSQKIATQCASVFNTPVRPLVTTESIQGKTVIVVHVPEITPSDKPIYFKSLGLPRGAFRRIGSTDQHCGDDDLQVLYAQRTGETTDRGAVPGALETDFDPEAIEHYRKIRAKVSPAAEELSWDDQDLLIALNAARWENGILTPTLAGIVLFGTRQAQRRLFPMLRVDYIRVPGNEWVADPDERFTTVDMRGPLLQLVQRAQDAVVDDLPKGFVLPEGQVQAQTPQLSSRVLREAIVNAVMHRSYLVQGPVQIIRYNNRIEIRNPGYSLKAEERLGEPGSETRNPNIAAVFHETNFAETKGSGIRTMRRLMDQSGFAPPTFESDRVGNQFVTRLLLHHFLNPTDLRWLAAFSELGLNDNQRKGLIFLREAGALDNATYRQINATDTLTASQDLRRLRQAHLLEKKGQGSATYYVPGVRFTGGSPGAGVLEAGGGVLADGTGVLVPGGGVLADLLQNIPDSLRNQLPEPNRRLTEKQTQELILELCALRAWSAKDFAALLGRDEKYLLRRFLSPLIEEGKLAYTEPDMRNHPAQAYRLPRSKKEGDR